MRIKNTIYIFITTILFFIICWAIASWQNFFIKEWNNWDAHVWSSSTANDNWKIVWDLIIEDSRSNAYKSWKRGTIDGMIQSNLYGDFLINSLELSFLSNSPTQAGCDDSLEVYEVTGEITSPHWWKMSVKSNSYFCSNQYTYILFDSETLGNKEIWELRQIAKWDVFGKQEIAISGIANLDKTNDTTDSILTRWDDNIEDIYLADSVQTYVKRDINKNIYKIINEFKAKWKLITSSFNFNSHFIWGTNEEKKYVYDFSWKSETLKLNGNDYINKWKNLEIGSNPDGITKIAWKNLVIVNEWNIFINANLSNRNDSKDLLILVSKKGQSGKWWNIYIHPDVTNIDAVIIADGSILSLKGNNLQDISNPTMKNNLRKQLLVYGSILSSNTVGSDIVPYGADYYENSSYSPVSLTNIYDLWNLRTFNLDLWKALKICDNGEKLAPINGSWDFLNKAWAGRKNCYVTDSEESGLRSSDKKNPLIVEFNPNIWNIQPKILQINK